VLHVDHAVLQGVRKTGVKMRKLFLMFVFSLGLFACDGPIRIPEYKVLCQGEHEVVDIDFDSCDYLGNCRVYNSSSPYWAGTLRYPVVGQKYYTQCITWPVDRLPKDMQERGFLLLDRDCTSQTCAPLR
jgi:hypothetical protein